MEKTIQISGLSKSYDGKKVIENLSFSVAAGEVYGLLGANGVGKSTTIECILGTKKADSGTVRILGLDPWTERKQLFKQVGVQFQEANYTEARVNGQWRCIDFFQQDIKGQLKIVPCVIGQSMVRQALEWDCDCNYVMGVPDGLSDAVRKECTDSNGVLAGTETPRWGSWYVIDGKWFDKVDFSMPEYHPDGIAHFLFRRLHQKFLTVFADQHPDIRRLSVLPRGKALHANAPRAGGDGHFHRAYPFSLSFHRCRCHTFVTSPVS